MNQDLKRTLWAAADKLRSSMDAVKYKHMNEVAVRDLGDETLKKIAVELMLSPCKSVTVAWAERETVRAKLRVMVKTLLRRYKYPPDWQEEATDTVLRQAESLSAEWVA